MKKIVYTKGDRLFIVHPVINTIGDEGVTEAIALDRALKRAVPPDAVDVRVVDESAIPADRTFRNAWKVSGSSITPDIERAKEIRKDRLRAERKPALEALDVQFIRAVEAGDSVKQAEIAAKKQALRDVTADPRFAAAQSVEDLKRIVLPSV